jgi:hypothetical protein
VCCRKQPVSYISFFLEFSGTIYIILFVCCHKLAAGPYLIVNWLHLTFHQSTRTWISHLKLIVNHGFKKQGSGKGKAQQHETMGMF